MCIHFFLQLQISRGSANICIKKYIYVFVHVCTILYVCVDYKMCWNGEKLTNVSGTLHNVDGDSSELFPINQRYSSTLQRYIFLVNRPGFIFICNDCFPSL